jgi:putative endonuclease
MARLAEHNRGTNRWTKLHRPFELMHSETFTDPAAARRRELFLKSGVGRQQLDAMVGKGSVKGE